MGRIKGVTIKSKICITCGESKKKNNIYFKFNSNKRNIGEDRLKDICRQCETEELVEYHRKDDKLLCVNCGDYHFIEKFASSPYYPYRSYKSVRCNYCMVNTSKNSKSKLTGESLKNAFINERLHGAKNRANNKGYNFNIDKEYLISMYIKQNGKCALSGKELTFTIYEGRTHTNFSVDRIDSSKGYIIGNIQIVCSFINSFKNELDNDLFIDYCKSIAKYNENKLIAIK